MFESEQHSRVCGEVRDDTSEDLCACLPAPTWSLSSASLHLAFRTSRLPRA